MYQLYNFIFLVLQVDEIFLSGLNQSVYSFLKNCVFLRYKLRLLSQVVSKPSLSGGSFATMARNESEVSCELSDDFIINALLEFLCEQEQRHIANSRLSSKMS